MSAVEHELSLSGMPQRSAQRVPEAENKRGDENRSLWRSTVWRRRF